MQLYKPYILFLILLFISFNINAQTASFTMDNDEGCGFLAVHFTNNSSGTGTLSYHWTFGNSGESNDENPDITYTSSGTFTVTLELTDDNGTSSFSDQVIVHPFPNVNFTSNNISGCIPISSQFTDASIIGDASLVNWNWNFGDGTSSTEQNPTHEYTHTGSYSVTLEVEDNLGCTNSTVYSNYINVSTPPNVSFTADPSINCEPINVQLTSSVSGFAPPFTYYWDFDDGGLSSLSNPIHFFQSGVHNVELTATDSYGCSANFTQEVSIVELNPNIQISNPNVCDGENAYYSNTQQSASVWDFGDGTANTFGITVSHIYEAPGTYTITLTAGSGDCSATTSESISVSAVPEANFNILPEVICEPTEIQLQSITSEATEFLWQLYYEDVYPDSLILEDNSPNTILDIQEEGRYIINLYVSNTICSSSFRDTIDVVFTKIDNIGMQNTFGCIPFSSNSTASIITSDPIVSYQWLLDNVEYSTNVSPPALVFDQVGEYENSLIIISEHGCTDTLTIDITAGTPPSSSFEVVEDSVCIEDIIHLTNTSPDSDIIDDYNWNWTFPGVLYYENNSTIAPDTVGYVYINLMAGYNGCYSLSEEDSVYIKGPFLSMLESDFSCDAPFYRTFNILAFDYNTLIWDYGDLSTPEETGTNTQHLFPNEQGYTISVTAHSNNSGCPDYLSTKDITISNPDYSVSIPDTSCNNLLIPLNEDPLVDSLFIIFGGAGGASYGWFNNNIEFISHTYTSGGNKEIMIIASGWDGCRDTIINTVYISVPSPSFSLSNTTICLSDTLHVNNTSVEPINLIEYQWFIDDTDTITAISDTSFQFLFSDGGLHYIYLWVEDSLGCSNSSDSSIIDVHKIEAIVTLEDSTLCLGDELLVIIDADLTNLEILCNYDDESPLNSTLNHTYLDTGFYNIEIQLIDDVFCKEIFPFDSVSVQEAIIQIDLEEDTLMCYPESPIFVNSDNTEPYYMSYEWVDNINNTSYVPEPEFLYSERGQYVISVKANTSNGCTDSTGFKLIIDGPYAKINISDDIVCKNDTVHFWMSNDTNLVSYEWTLGDGFGISNTESFDHSFLFVPENGSFEIVLSYPAEGCDADGDGQDDKYKQIEQINIFPASANFDIYNIETGLLDTNSCSPLPVEFLNNSQGNSNTYQWQINGSVYSNSEQADNFVFTNNESLIDTFLITLYLESVESCKDTAFQEIIVRSIPKINISESELICVGDTTEIWASGGESIEWSSLSPIQNNNNYNITIAPQESTMYYAQITESNACQNSDSVLINVQQIPELFSSYEDTTVIVGLEFELNVSTDQEGISYSWEPSDGLSCSDCPSPEIMITQATEYLITIQDSAHCHTVQKNIFIDIFYDYTLDIPNTFTPNKDGENDIIYVKGWGLKDLLEFRIYNRWGEEVFFSNDLKVGWDGTKNGKDQNIDSYAYFIRAITFNNKELTKKGTITLLR